MPKKKKDNKNILIVLVVVIVFLVIATVYYFSNQGEMERRTDIVGMLCAATWLKKWGRTIVVRALTAMTFIKIVKESGNILTE